MTVFVVQEPKRRVTSEMVAAGRANRQMVGALVPVFDISPALMYGPIEVLLERSTGLTTEDIEGAVHVIREKLAEYGDEDYILAAGDPTAIGIAIALAVQANNGRVRVLRWNRHDRVYVEVMVDFNEKGLEG